MWLIAEITISHPYGNVVLIDMPDKSDAINAGIEYLEAQRCENGFEEPLHVLAVVEVPVGGPELHRVVLTGERVPNEFQCCGGMPFDISPGAYNEHTATCHKVEHDTT